MLNPYLSLIPPTDIFSAGTLKYFDRVSSKLKFSWPFFVNLYILYLSASRLVIIEFISSTIKSSGLTFIFIHAPLMSETPINSDSSFDSQRNMKIGGAFHYFNHLLFNYFSRFYRRFDNQLVMYLHNKIAFRVPRGKEFIQFDHSGFYNIRRAPLYPGIDNHSLRS